MTHKQFRKTVPHYFKMPCKYGPLQLANLCKTFVKVRKKVLTLFVSSSSNHTIEKKTIAQNLLKM